MTDFYSYTFNKPELLAPAVARPHRLQHAWALWTQKKVKTKNAKTSWYDGTTCVGRFDTVEGFWQVYSHLLKPEQLTGSVDVMLFKDGVKPFWEDDQNRHGGRVTFDSQAEICGTVLSVRYHDNHISIWNRSADNEAAVANIKEVLAKTLNLPSWITLDYTRHKNPDKEKGAAAAAAAPGAGEGSAATHPAEQGAYAGQGSTAPTAVSAAPGQYASGASVGPGPAGAPSGSAPGTGMGGQASGWRGGQGQGHAPYAGSSRYGDRADRGERGGYEGGRGGGGYGYGGRGEREARGADRGEGSAPQHAGAVGEMDAVPLTLRRSYTGGRDSSHLQSAPTPHATPIAQAGDGAPQGQGSGMDARPVWNKPAAPWNSGQQGGSQPGGIDGSDQPGMSGGWSRPAPGHAQGGGAAQGGQAHTQPPLPMGIPYEQGHHRGGQQQQQHYRPGGGWGARREGGPRGGGGGEAGGHATEAEGWQTVPGKR